MEELASLKGIGPGRIQALHAAGIFSLRDLLFTLPKRYKDLSAYVKLGQTQSGEQALIQVVRVGEAKCSFHGKLSRVSCLFKDETGTVLISWFNQPWMRKQLNERSSYGFYGRIEHSAQGLRMTNPTVEKECRIVPVYPSIEGLPQRVHENIMREALKQSDEMLPETLPEEIIRRYQLLSAPEAIRILHRPTDMESLAKAKWRYDFEQMLLYNAAIFSMGEERKNGIRIRADQAEIADFWENLPFTPTSAQRRTLDEIAADMASEKPMARMVQGDVGSGKTAVAMGAMWLCVKRGYQASLMAPTEILARQHYESVSSVFEANGIACVLLIGGLPAKERREALQKIADGSAKIIIGTHALLSPSVQFAKLALCISDEQHRFGVRQRERLGEKGKDTLEDRLEPNVLVMSATPIPRSLALILYGDLAISVLDELPPGRTPVVTRIVPEEKRADMNRFLMGEMDRGHQVYMVCPLVEEPDEDGLKSVKQYARELSTKVFRNYRVGLLYGSQLPEEKAETLQRFSTGEIQLLVSTTVVEVGVNVPSATVMVIEDADQYGLAQLHQLRGRVGRGSLQSWCFLMSKPNERLRTIAHTNDGFEIARADLEQRGPGELMGTRQHGEMMLPCGAVSDTKAMYEAQRCAENLRNDPAQAAVWQALTAAARQKIGRLSEKVSLS